MQFPSQQSGIRGKVFRDPIHGLISVDPDDSFVLALIDTPDLAQLAELSCCFLLRRKLFHCCELGQPRYEQMLKLSSDLSEAGRQNIDWLLDDPKFTSYRDYDSGFRGSAKDQEKEAVSTSAILMADGSLTSIARRVEAVSEVLDALGKHPQGSRASLCRLYYHQRIATQVEKSLEDLGLTAKK